MIVCLRVDERLIHGQVAMTWTKELKLNGLVVASDEAAFITGAILDINGGMYMG